MGFGGLVADPVRTQQDLQAGLEGENADQPRVLVDPDRPVSWNRGMLLDQPLNDTGREQHRVDIVLQRRPVMAVTINPVDGVAHLKSVKCHKTMMPNPHVTALTSIKRPLRHEGEPAPDLRIRPSIRAGVNL